MIAGPPPYPSAPLCGILCAMQATHPTPADSHLTPSTRDVVQRYHDSWKRRDLDAALALYHPEVEYNDYFQNRRMGLADLREYVTQTMPSRPDEFLDHIDRIRVDGDTAFIQYRTAITLSGRLAVFHSSEAISVRDGLIWRINEYATLVREDAPGAARASGDSRPPASRLGLSPRQLSQLAADLEEYFHKAQPYLAPDLDLSQVAGATGYTRHHAVTVEPRKVAVVDTVGAGDTFNAGILASLHEQGLLTKAAIAGLSEDAVRAALTLGARAAAVTVSRAGANPPWRHELG